MALAQYIAGMGFSNVGLGIVHSMAHGLSALYDTPHGVACAIILPTGLEYNAEYSGEKYRALAKAMGVQGTESMTQAEYRKAAIDAVKKLSADVGIPANLKGILKEEDVQFLAESAFADACCPGNPRDTSVEEIAALYRSPDVRQRPNRHTGSKGPHPGKTGTAAAISAFLFRIALTKATARAAFR